jgi:hypothetical protein
VAPLRHGAVDDQRTLQALQALHARNVHENPVFVAFGCSWARDGAIF